ncbi:hypothetical protein MYSTI_05783 [Myxococcus stipitatus DSM 14675]|uniref:WGR domain-containing protein n=1 Tax=Myxococcus stipitatus (strain DSM 14675 / JCM 12634 / Mx s8) TaxID=1278073 RepID=L7UKT9_MYXSD|nr:hypothetical protein [Myxococcus stipitatus]AGC47059.1 hypothetical protein MYSTI_05783 [Myxococcus stipitatus DSM 14675]
MDAETAFGGVTLAGNELRVREGSLGDKGRTKRTAFKDEKQARSAASTLIAKLGKQGFTERKL